MAKKILRLGPEKLSHRSFLLFNFTTTNYHDGNAVGFPHDQLGGGGDFIRDGRDRSLELIATTIFSAPLVFDGFQSGDPHRHVHRANTPDTAKTIADNHPRIFSSPAADFLPDLPGGSIRILR